MIHDLARRLDYNPDATSAIVDGSWIRVAAPLPTWDLVIDGIPAACIVLEPTTCRYQAFAFHNEEPVPLTAHTHLLEAQLAAADFLAIN